MEKWRKRILYPSSSSSGEYFISKEWHEQYKFKIRRNGMGNYGKNLYFVTSLNSLPSWSLALWLYYYDNLFFTKFNQEFIFTIYEYYILCIRLVTFFRLCEAQRFWKRVSWWSSGQWGYAYGNLIRHRHPLWNIWKRMKLKMKCYLLFLIPIFG